MLRRFLLLCVVVPSLSSSVAGAAEHRVDDAAAIEAALERVQPGDELVMTDGVWRDQEVVFAAEGTAEAPITLRPATPGGVVLTGESNLSISGRHLVVSGLHFKEGLPGDLSHVVQFRGPLGEAEHCRLTESVITRYNPADPETRYFWVSLYGRDNRVDHCRFVNQNHSGCTVVAWLGEGPARHLIDHNHFLDRPPAAERANGFETMRLGDSKHGHVDARITVENNLFERCDGEVEVISNKSNENVFRGNTFRACEGTLTLRHGHRAVVEGNFFLGEDKKDSGGIRVIGEGHRIVGNYIADVDDRMDGAISVVAGIENTQANGYQQVKDVLIANNTIVRVAGAAVKLDWGLGQRDRTLLPVRVTVRDNLLVSEGAPLIDGHEGPGWVWSEQPRLRRRPRRRAAGGHRLRRPSPREERGWPLATRERRPGCRAGSAA